MLPEGDPCEGFGLGGTGLGVETSLGVEFCCRLVVQTIKSDLVVGMYRILTEQEDDC